MDDLSFEWDPDKADQNLRKHGVSFREAEQVFRDPLLVVRPDLYHSEGEERFIAIGTSDGLRLLVVVYTERGEVIRIISARLATRREKRAYEDDE